MIKSIKITVSLLVLIILSVIFYNSNVKVERLPTETLSINTESAEIKNTQTSNAETENPEVTTNETKLSEAGIYGDYAENALTKNKNILFFKASWCHTCSSLDKALESEKSKIPSGVSILKLDYDKETTLKKKYGVIVQHTLVQVDNEGKLLKKWSGSSDLADILSEVI